MNKKIVVFSPMPPPFGGIARWTLLLKKISNDTDPGLLNFYDTSIKSRSRFSKGTFNRIFVHIPFFIHQFYSIGKILILNDVKIAHICTSGGAAFLRDLFAALISKIKSDQKLILHFHFGRIPEIVASKSLEYYLLKLLLILADKVVVLDIKTQIEISKINPNLKVYLIPNSIQTELINPSNVKKNYVVFAGWVTKSKGIEDLLSAWSITPNRNWLLKIAGPYDLAYLNYLKNTYPLANVEFLGELDNSALIELMCDSKILCLPSHTEGFPFVVLEGMASGCAIIATNVGAIPEIINDDAGILVEKNNPSQISSSLNILFENNELIEVLAKNARNKSLDNFDIKSNFSQYKSLWK